MRVLSIDRYVCEDCSDCPLKKECTKAKGNREIEVNHTLNEYKRQVRELLTSERGLYHRSKRPIEPETVFGQIKDAHMFRRFRLRSIPKVNVEFDLVAMAHNLRKLAKLIGDTSKKNSATTNSHPSIITYQPKMQLLLPHKTKINAIYLTKRQLDQYHHKKEPA